MDEPTPMPIEETTNVSTGTTPVDSQAHGPRICSTCGGTNTELTMFGYKCLDCAERAERGEIVWPPRQTAETPSAVREVALNIHELAYLLTLMSPRMVHPLGEEATIVNLFVKLNTAFHDLKPGDETMPAGGESYDKANHIPDRAGGDMTKQAGGHAEPATKKYMKMKSVAQVMGETPHMPAPRDTETAIRKGNGGSIKENKGS